MPIHKLLTSSAICLAIANSVLLADARPGNGGADDVTVEKVSVSCNPVSKAGDKITVTATASAGCSSKFTIPGSTIEVPMTESSAGTYSGSYVVQDMDTVSQSKPVVSIWRAGLNPVSKEADDSITIDGTPPTVTNLNPPPDTFVADRLHVIEVVLNDGKGTGIDPGTIKFRVDGKDVTTKCIVNGGVLKYDPPAKLHGEKVSCEVLVADKAGNVSDVKWSYFFKK